MVSPVSQVVIGVRHVDEALDEVSALDKTEKDLWGNTQTKKKNLGNALSQHVEIVWICFNYSTLGPEARL